MVKLSWQMTVLYAIGMIILGVIIIVGFFVEAAAEMKWQALTLLAAILGYGGGKAQTMWEIRKENGNVRRKLPAQRDGGADDPPTG